MQPFEVHFPGGKQVAAKYKGLTILTDQPISAGGEGQAPSPFELFAASLATCAGFFVLSFCQQRNIPTDSIGLVQNAETDPQTHLISEIDIEIRLPSDFPDKYREAVVRAAELCTVKKHLQNPPRVRVSASKLIPNAI